MARLLESYLGSRDRESSLESFSRTGMRSKSTSEKHLHMATPSPSSSSIRRLLNDVDIPFAADDDKENYPLAEDSDHQFRKSPSLEETRNDGSSLSSSRSSVVLADDMFDSEKDASYQEDMMKEQPKTPASKTPSKARPRNGNRRSRDIEMVPSRSLRKRTMTQKHPYLSDKTQYKRTKSGEGARRSDIEEEMEQILGTQKRQTKAGTKPTKADNKTVNKASRRTPVDSPLSVQTSRSLSAPSSLKPSIMTEEYMIQNTTLHTWLENFDYGSAPLPLSKCPDLPTLWDFVEGRWLPFAHDAGQQVNFISCILPWKGSNSKILIRKNWVESYEEMVAEIFRAPWDTLRHDGRLEVKLIVILSDRPARDVGHVMSTTD